MLRLGPESHATSTPYASSWTASSRPAVAAERDDAPGLRARLEPRLDVRPAVALVPAELEVRHRPGAGRLPNPRRRDREPLGNLLGVEELLAHAAAPL
jgi:hypothetical protein